MIGVDLNNNQSGWHGKLNMIFSDRAGITKIISDRTQAPLKIQRPFYPENPDICHTVILHTAGGIVGGDRLSLNLHLQPNSKALITTASASKIYRSNGLQARQNIEIKIDNNAYLEWFPQETIIFNDAIYRQNLQVELAENATWLGWEIIRFGRSARGEKFTSGEWRSHTEIWQQNRPLWIDRQSLQGSEANFNSYHALATQPIIGTFALIGQEITSELVPKIRSLFLDHFPANNNNKYNLAETGVTRLEKGIICRYRGQSTAQARNWFISVWHLLRLTYLNRPSCPPRVWPI